MGHPFVCYWVRGFLAVSLGERVLSIVVWVRRFLAVSLGERVPCSVVWGWGALQVPPLPSAPVGMTRFGGGLGVRSEEWGVGSGNVFWCS
jgi:hypothetical protein